MTCMNRRKAEAMVYCFTSVLLLFACATDLRAQLSGTQKTPGSTSASVALAKHPKLATPLAQVANVVGQTAAKATAAAAPVSANTLPEPARSTMKAGRMRISAAGAVQVYIRVSSLNTANLNALKAAGVTVQLTDAKRNIVQAMVPASALQSVAALSFVNSVSLPRYGYANTGSVTSEGDAVLKAANARSQYGVTGKGIKVGVLADGIAGIFGTGCTTCSGVAGGPISTADIPTATGTRSATGILTSTTGGIVAQSFRTLDGNLEAGLSDVGNEGTAMIEVIYDLAPDATFYFANFQTDIEFASAMNWLAQNTDIVVDDISFFDPPYDGTNAVSTNAATALNTDANPVRTIITSVGNEAQSHYVEAYTDSHVDSASVVGTTVPGYTGDFHLFQATTATKDVCGLGTSTRDPAFVRTGFDLNVTLTWDDPVDTSANDYDLWLLDGTGKVVAFSANLQNGGVGGQPPIESLDYVNAGPPAFFYIAITNASNAAAAKHLNVYVRGSDPIAPNAGALVPPVSCTSVNGEVHNYNTPGGSVPAMGDAGGSPASVISAGAVPWNSTTTIEPYSSQGPTVDGRVKPDITGVDLVTVSGAGGFVSPFWGTSAAAPHIAGIAALLLQASPCLASGSTGAISPGTARTALYNALTKNAFPLATPEPNNVFGYGLADALSSSTALIPVASAGGNRTVAATSASGATVTFDGSGSTDPSSCPLTYAWSGGCGTGTGVKPSLTCPMGNSTVTLAVSNNGGVTTSKATAVITVTDFTVGATTSSATVAKGSTATYNLTVGPAASGGSFASAVALACTGAPSEATCTVNPTSVTPGSTNTPVTVTVTTTAQKTAALKVPSRPGTHSPAIPMFASMLGLAGIALVGKRRSRRITFMVVTLLLLASIGMFVGCGGGGGSTATKTTQIVDPGTPSGTYTLVVTGTSGSASHTMNLTLTVQ